MGRRKGDRLSEEHRRRIGNGVRKAAKRFALPVTPRPRRLSPMHKRRIAEGQCRRWQRRNREGDSE